MCIVKSNNCILYFIADSNSLTNDQIVTSSKVEAQKHIAHPEHKEYNAKMMAFTSPCWTDKNDEQRRLSQWYNVYYINQLPSHSRSRTRWDIKPQYRRFAISRKANEFSEYTCNHIKFILNT